MMYRTSEISIGKNPVGVSLYLCIDENIKDVVRVCLGPPLKSFSQILMLQFDEKNTEKQEAKEEQTATKGQTQKVFVMMEQ